MTLNLSPNRPSTPLLDTINAPSDLRGLSLEQQVQLAYELRAFLLYSVQQTGGHLGAGLGVVELTIALHSQLDAPNDNLIWDVGHQAYPHKILTGRREQMLSMRKQNGLAPFPARKESEYDAFGTGHSSTSISAALGVALANQLQGLPYRSVAVIGDGAMTAGMAFEALTHAAHTRANMLVVLNDNEMSISENVGGLATYLAQNSPSVTTLPLSDQTTGDIFTSLGLNYVGPIDGHNLADLNAAIGHSLSQQGPTLLHVRTRKGKGLKEAEADPIGYHAIAKTLGSSAPATNKKPTYANVFGQWACKAAASNEQLVAITPAMREGSDLIAFSKQFSARYFDVAIAEQHAVTLAAGMATRGLKPVVAIYSTFLQRGYDQLIHDVVLQDLPVLFAIDRAGLVGEDGPTHHGCFDISYMACLPSLSILAPANAQSLTQMLDLSLAQNSPVAVRYPRGEVADEATCPAVVWGKSATLRQGNKVAILNFGPLLNHAQAAAEQLNATLVDMRFIKPLDHQAIQIIAQNHDVIVTLEDHVTIGGAGSLVLSELNTLNYTGQCLNLGIRDEWVEHASRNEQLAQQQLDAHGIVTQVSERL